MDPVRSVVEAKINKDIVYSTMYGIDTSEPNDTNPFSDISMYTAENVYALDIRKRHYQNYIHFKIKELFGLSVDEYLERPSSECFMLHEIATAEARKKKAKNDTEGKEIDQILGSDFN